jgi:hypothetical protein
VSDETMGEFLKRVPKDGEWHRGLVPDDPNVEVMYGGTFDLDWKGEK